MTRITLRGDRLADFGPPDPACHIKLFIPESGTDDLTLPSSGPNGLTYPEGATRPAVRTYTPRRFDAATCEIQVDFVHHSGGVASNWAQNVRPGDPAGIAGPGRGYHPEPDTDWLLIAADATALPAAATLLETAPPGLRIIAFIEVVDDTDELPLATRADVELRWLHRGTRAMGDLLADTVMAYELPPGDGRAWTATESTTVRRIRDHLTDNAGMDRSHMATRGYWRAGEVGYHDHDYGED